jgi:rhodanese-related sulfurtransferase
MLIRRSIALLTFLALGLSACQSNAGRSESDPADAPSEASASYTDIDVAQFGEMMGSKDFLLVNVHIPYEGEIPGTDLTIPFDKIDQALDQLGGEDAKIVLYCRSDRMSRIASERLTELGYTDVYNVVGGMRAWTDAGHELEYRSRGG